MQLSKNTSRRSSTLSLLIKLAVILGVIIGTITLLGKIDFPSPYNEIEKIIPNEKLRIVK